MCSALRRASRLLTQHYEKSFRGTGLRATQFTVLATLAQTGPVSMGKLAEIMGLERTTLTRNLGPLEKAKLISAEVGSDQRIRKIELTTKGLSKAHEGLAAWKRAQAGADQLLHDSGIAELLQNTNR